MGVQYNLEIRMRSNRKVKVIETGRRRVKVPLFVNPYPTIPIPELPGIEQYDIWRNLTGPWRTVLGFRWAQDWWGGRYLSNRFPNPGP